MGCTNLFTFKCSTVFFNSLRSALGKNPQFLDLFIDPEGDCRIQLEAEVKVVEAAGRGKVRVRVNIASPGDHGGGGAATRQGEAVSWRAAQGPDRVTVGQVGLVAREQAQPAARPRRRNNRLEADQEFLAALAALHPAVPGPVGRRVRAVARDTVTFLHRRDNFWRQIDN